MTNYQKAIKVRKVCENQESCRTCKFLYNCSQSTNLSFIPSKEKIEIITKAIKEEKWNVK